MPQSSRPRLVLRRWKHVLLPAITVALVAMPGSSGRAAEVASQTAGAPGIVEGQVTHAVTGRSLNNARLVVKGTDIRGFSDEFGRFRLLDVPPGPATLEVFYTGLDSQEAAVTIAAGGVVTLDLRLTNAALYETGGKGPARLDPFLVESARMTDQAAIAINEQRFAPNIKTVVATGDISEQPDGNIGEFLKMMPGVATGGGGTVPSQVFIRGFPPSTTQITVDGASIASTTFAAPDRQVQVSNDTPGTGISRLEVTKVPTPATGADTMAGSVNMVTRTAFEADRAQLTYLVNVAGVLSQIGLERKTGWEDERLVVKPGFSVRYTNPVTKNFGYAISASSSLRQRPEANYSATRNVNSPTFETSPARPMLQTAEYLTGAGIFETANLALRADWRVAPHSMLSGSVETYHWRGLTANFTLGRGVGTVATPTIGSGVAGTFGPDTSIGATGRGSVTYANTFSNHNKAGLRGNLRYGFNNTDWKIDLQTGLSKARFWRTDGKEGLFSRVVTSAVTSPLRVELRDIDPSEGPRTIRIFDNSNREIDLADPAIHAQTTVTRADLLPRWNTDIVQDYKADVKRRIRVLPFPAAVQVGGAYRGRTMDYQEKGTQWTYRGPGGNQTPVPFVTYQEFYVGDVKGKSLPMVSPVLAYRAWEKDQSLFYQTPAQIAEAERIYRFGSERIQETAEALYFQADGRFLRSRLHLLAGVRYERTTGKGAGSLNIPDAVWRRNADGSYVLAANGSRVRKAEAGAAGSLEEIQLVWQRRTARTSRTYDGFYPSVHLNYNVTENVLARAAYAQTYGRPNFSFIVPRTVVNEQIDSDGDPTGGRLTVRNPALRPWTADNFDLSLEYYTPHGGVFGAGLFRKEVKGFFGDVVRPASAFDLQEAGIDPGSVDVSTWTVSTTTNAADAVVNGFELSMNHSLRPLDRWLGGWTRNFSVYANATKLRITGPGADDLSGFLPFGINGGVRFTRRPFTLSVSANHRGKETIAVVTNLGPNGRNYRPARTHIDAALAITLRRNVEFFFNVRNLFNEPNQSLAESDVLPSYSQRNGNGKYGAVFNAGIKGTY